MPLPSVLQTSVGPVLLAPSACYTPRPHLTHPPTHSPHRISGGDSLLFMRCVSLTKLVSAWWRGEAPSAILAKPLSDCVTVFCLRQCKSRHLNVCEILKRKYMLCQINWMSCILNWGVRCDVVGDTGHTCCCCCSFLLTFPPPNWRTSLMTEIEVSVRQQI